MQITKEDIARAVFGGCILGGGGGGKIENGLEIGSFAFSYGEINIEPIDSFNDNDIIITTTSIGAPSAKNKFVKPHYHIKAVNNLIKTLEISPSGFITGENGATETVDGWLQAAAFDVPVLDAPAAGRAHPTAIMGSMGLFKDIDYTSCRSAIGGDPSQGRYVELVVMGSIEKTASLVRRASIEAGGTVVMARDPLKVSFLKERAAIGAISEAISIGKTYLDTRERGAEYCVTSICDYLGGRILGTGEIDNLSFCMKDGFDIGEMTLRCNNGKLLNVFFWNEYMGVELEGERLATFPDLIMTFSSEDGYPIVSADLKEGMSIYLIAVDKDKLNLGYGMKLNEPYESAEEATGKEIVKYLAFE